MDSKERDREGDGMKRLTNKEIATIVKMKGVGYKNAEIARRLGKSQSAIQYRLAKLRREAERDGIDTVFIHVLANADNRIGAIFYLTQILKDGGN